MVKSFPVVLLPWCTHPVSLLSCSCTNNTMSVIHEYYRGPCCASEVTRTQWKAAYNLVCFHVTCAVLVAPLLMYIMELPHDNLPKPVLWDKRSCAGLQAGLGLGEHCKMQGGRKTLKWKKRRVRETSFSKACVFSGTQVMIKRLAEFFSPTGDVPHKRYWDACSDSQGLKARFVPLIHEASMTARRHGMFWFWPVSLGSEAPGRAG